MNTLKRIWAGWKAIAAKIAHFQSNLLLGLIYVVVVAPLGLIFKLFGQDPMLLKDRVLNSYWMKRKPITSITEFMKKEF
jgi:hypothetical protein